MGTLSDSFDARADLPAAAVAGAVAGAAFLLAMAGDLALVKHKADDRILLGRFVTADPDRARSVGTVLHLASGAALGMVYAAVAQERLAGPPWLRGAIFATVENTLLYPLALLENHHPGIRDGHLDRYWTPVAFAQSIPRHLVYGAVLGSLYARLRR